MGDKFSFPCTSGAVGPVTCVIGVEHILVCHSDLSFKTTAIAACITIGRIGVLYDVDLLITFCADLPMLCSITKYLLRSLVPVFVDVTAVCAGLVAAVREGVLSVSDSTIAVGTACPVVNVIGLPIRTQSMRGKSLLFTHAADLLVICFIDVREVSVCMFTGSGNGFTGFRTAITTCYLTSAFFNTCRLG